MKTVPAGRTHRTPLMLVVLTILVLTVAAWTSDAAAPRRVARCLVVHPSGTCRPVLGITAPYPSITSLTQAESRLGHHFRLVHTFHPVTATLPSAYERYVVTHGALLHISIDAYAGTGANRHWVPWRTIANGRYDGLLTRQARSIKGLHVPVLVTFEHEPDQAAKTVRGTPADFVAAWRHVHSIYARVGATNVVWVWVMVGYPGDLQRDLPMWPGNDEVDWVGWDPYDNTGCYATPGTPKSFGEVAMPFLRWWWQTKGTHGIARFKPLMISETGSAVRSGAMTNRTWFASIVPFLRRHTAIRAVSLWDHQAAASKRRAVPSCTFRFDDVPGAIAPFQEMARSPYWLS